MTTAVQHRRGTTAEHATFTGLEGELTIDTTKDTAVIHDGVTAGGVPLARENLSNVSTSGLSSIDGASTASDDKFFVYDQSATTLKTITRAELNNAMEQDALANVAITGGTINGTTIGGTTAAAVAATTLTTSSTVTHNGGTANGVAYLNGSKVLTSGSALTFDGTNFATTGNVTGKRLDASYAGQATIFVTDTSGAASQFAIVVAQTGNESWIGTTTNTSLAFRTNGTEGMRLTSSGNLGIGTSSPSRKLTVFGSNNTTNFEVGGSSGGASFNVYNNTTSNSVSLGTSGASMSFAIAGSDKVYLDSSGNLGLGVTPSAWDTVTVLQIKNASLYGYSTTECGVMQNAYYATGWKYITTGNLATKYDQVSGSHRWHIAPSGTAGDAITFIQAMTLDTSGNLGIGETSPTVRLHAKAANPTRGIVGRIVNSSTSSQTGSQIQFTQAAVADWAIGQPAGENAFAFWSGRDAGSADGTERMRIDSSGNLLVGQFGTGFENSNSITLEPASGGYSVYNHISGSSSGNKYIYFAYGASGIGSITQNGTTGVLYNTSSDYRLKNIKGPVTNAKDFIMALQPKQGTWKSDGSPFVGFVAHEFQEVSPSSVSGVKDAVDEDGNPIMQSMQASSPEVMANLVALLQEQQAIIETLKARLDAANL